MNKTAIEYLDFSWNPIAMRCTPAGKGCKNCWHLAIANRMAANPRLSDDVRAAYAGGSPVLKESELDAPLRLRKPATIGCQFMGDLFHEDVRFEIIERVFEVIRLAVHHTFIILTKRPRTAKMFLDPNLRSDTFKHWPFSNVILGVSVSNQRDADELIPILLRTAAAKRAVSYEPALGAVDFGQWVFPQSAIDGYDEVVRRFSPMLQPPPSLGRPQRLDWIIAGCESGPRRRPAELDWFRGVHDQCVAAGVPYFLKQAEIDGRVVKMPALDGVVWNQMPEVTHD